MSKSLTALFFVFFHINCFSQNKTSDKTTIYIDLNLKSVVYSISKDSTSAAFNFDYKSFNSENKLKDQKTKSFITFTSNEKPQKLNGLELIDYVSLKDFCTGNIKTTSPTYIIYQNKNGTFERWKTINLPEE